MRIGDKPRITVKVWVQLEAVFNLAGAKLDISRHFICVDLGASGPGISGPVFARADWCVRSHNRHA